MFSKADTAVVAFGRMNPPTTGHNMLIEKLKSFPGDHYLFLSHTVDRAKNPLSFEIKKFFCEKFFDGVIVGHPDVRTPVDMMKHLDEAGYTKVIFVAGSDRVDQFQKLFNDYNGVDYHFESINVVNAGRRCPDGDGIESVSATKLREAAKTNNYPVFVNGIPVKKHAIDLFKELRKVYEHR